MSPHFLLSDFLGNNTVYSKGRPNGFLYDEFAELRMENLRCLCDEGLEKILAEFGPISISYGYISPDLSREIVKYQDPDKPSHHRFDLGAAVDFCAHRWVQGLHNKPHDLYLTESIRTSPIALAHLIDYLEIPYSRLITYSESPYICLALSAAEFVRDQPRKAFYENRYLGVEGGKPNYMQYASYSAKAKALERLQNGGLHPPWQGKGYPTFHGGGFRQLQHMRVSKYTMVSDWLFDLKSISNGGKNHPSLELDAVQDAFAAAGTVYDRMLETWDVPRASIVEGYLSHHSEYHNDDFPGRDWRNPTICFRLSPPTTGGHGAGSLIDRMAWVAMWNWAGTDITIDDDGFILVVVDVDTVLSSKDWE